MCAITWSCVHCKDVTVRETNVPLTKENVTRMMDTWTSYVRTEGLVFINGKEYAVVFVHGKKGTGLFREVSDYEILALPEDTVFVDDPEFDVINLPALAELQSKHPGKTVVVRGMFSHINFIKDLKQLTLNVIDNVPPSPSKLGVLVQRALESGFVELPIIVNEKIIDMAEETPKVTTEAVMFPCKVSGLKADIPTYFLDEAPELKHDVTLIGCHLSERIFKELYKKDVKFINVCPDDFVTGGKTIVKCCKIKEGCKIDGNVAKVPWGATVPEVADAINKLFS